MVVSAQRADPVRLLWRRVFLLALVVAVLLAASGVWKIYTRERESAALNRESQTRLADLFTRQDQLQKDIANLNTDRGKEAALREQYQMGRQGEGLIIIVNPATPVVPHAASSPITDWFKKFLPWW